MVQKLSNLIDSEFTGIGFHSIDCVNELRHQKEDEPNKPYELILAISLINAVPRTEVIEVMFQKSYSHT